VFLQVGVPLREAAEMGPQREEGAMNVPSQRVLRVLLPALIVGIAGFVPVARAGGWGVITLDDFPDHFVAGEPIELTFTARAHGVTPISGFTAGASGALDLRFSIVAMDGKNGVARGTVSAEGASGRYRALLTLPHAGDWSIGIMGSTLAWPNAALPSTRAVEAGDGAAAVPLSAAERGLRLFVAKGCVSCHTHDAARGMGQSLNVGPVLTDRRLPETYLAAFLADPASFRTAQTRAFAMPNLEMEPHEISALVAFLNAGS
jgi:mono/diheme cytochrome c family protein